MPQNAIYNFSNEPTGTHRLILSEVAHGSKVLDVGCAAGYLGAFLNEQKSCQVWGIEPDVNSWAQAQGAGYRAVINLPIEQAATDDKLQGQKFDCIILADVLEHTVHPEQILQALTPLLATKGKMIISLPNIAHYSIRWALLHGRWAMTESGILDRTHLHFYNYAAAVALLRGQGFAINKLRPRGDLERWFRKLGLESVGRAILFWFPNFWAAQFIFVVSI